MTFNKYPPLIEVLGWRSFARKRLVRVFHRLSTPTQAEVLLAAFLAGEQSAIAEVNSHYRDANDGTRFLTYIEPWG